MLKRVLDRVDGQREAAVGRMKDLLSIPSVSTDKAYRPHTERAAAWVADRLRECGLDVAVHDVGGPPAVLGRSRDREVMEPGSPRVMFYGHYDVQPPDPVEKWTSPPFEPTVRDGAVYARGASDDKGQVCCFLEALRAWKETHGKLPGPVTVLIEGEEECGSVHLERFVQEHKAQLAADVIVISDTSMWDPAQPGEAPIPAITYALRGLLYYDLKLHGPKRDLHSGVYGGTLANPCTVLTGVLGRLFDADRRVTIPGYYDDVLPIDPEEERQWAELGFDEKAYLGSVGAKEPYGEAGFTTLQRRWARPACDVNGLYGGYGGEGAKTVIPAFAGAKVSFRLAANQNAKKIGEAFEAWLRGQEVGGCRWEITQHGAVDAVAVPLDSPWIRATKRAVEAAAGREPVLVREGATIPVVSWFKSMLGTDSVLVGFGLNSDNIHSPDEHFGIDRFILGCRTHAALLAEVGKRRG